MQIGYHVFIIKNITVFCETEQTVISTVVAIADLEKTVLEYIRQKQKDEWIEILIIERLSN